MRAHQPLHTLNGLKPALYRYYVTAQPDLDKRAQERPRPTNAA
jgi:hypothetical protein